MCQYKDAGSDADKARKRNTQSHVRTSFTTTKKAIKSHSNSSLLGLMASFNVLLAGLCYKKLTGVFIKAT